VEHHDRHLVGPPGCDTPSKEIGVLRNLKDATSQCLDSRDDDRMSGNIVNTWYILRCNARKDQMFYMCEDGSIHNTKIYMCLSVSGSNV
jgi:hypothetical protein